MLAHHNDATAAEVLAFLSVFLYDGNEVVQVRWLAYVHVCTKVGEVRGMGWNGDHATGDCSPGVSDTPVHTHACTCARLAHTHNHA